MLFMEIITVQARKYSLRAKCETFCNEPCWHQDVKIRRIETVMSLPVLYECEIRCLTLREQPRVTVLQQ
jgi:hypothetical protein